MRHEPLLGNAKSHLLLETLSLALNDHYIERLTDNPMNVMVRSVEKTYATTQR
jgi:hypothetical protein